MANDVVITQNPNFTGAVCVQINFKHDLFDMRGALLREAGAVVTDPRVDQVAMKPARNRGTVYDSGLYTVTPGRQGDNLQALVRRLKSRAARLPRR